MRRGAGGRRPRRPRRRRHAVGYLVGENSGLDQILFQGKLGSNRIAPNTGLNFLLVGAALGASRLGDASRRRPAQLVAPGPHRGRLDLGARLRVRGRRALRRRSVHPMALPTALAFLCCRSERCARVPTGGSPRSSRATIREGSSRGGSCPRRMLIPSLLGWLRLVGEHMGLFTTELGLAIVVVLSILLFMLLIWVTSRSLKGAATGRAGRASGAWRPSTR